MNKEIKLRKRRFWAICFVIVFAMIQSIPSSVLAADYTTDGENLTPATTVLNPGDVINYVFDPYAGGIPTIFYCDADTNKTVIDSESYSNSSAQSFTVRDYMGTALSADDFKEWKVEEINGSSGALVSIRLVAVSKYTRSTITYVLNGGTNAESNPDSYNEGKTEVILADAEKEGCTFEGWYSDADFTTRVTSIPTTQIGDVTLHAKFVEDDIHVTAPSITTQPGNATVKVGETATFTIAASGDNLTYQWQIDKNDGNGWVNIAGANEASYTTSTVNMSCNGFKYQCVVSNLAGTVTSNTAVLTVTENTTPDPDPVDYDILDGANSSWEQNSDGSLSIRGSGALSKFVGVKVDGTLVDAKNYNVKEGSTIVTLKADYLNTLSVGTHTFEILWTDGSASTTFTSKANTADNSNNNQNDNNNSDSSDDKPSSGTDKKDDVAKTGDNTPIVWLFILSILSGTGLIITVKKRRENLNS